MLLYIIPIYVAGITQGLMWRAFDETGSLAYPDFVETVMRLMPLYWIRVLGGALYLSGAVIGVFNIFMTWKTRPAVYDVPVHERRAGQAVPSPTARTPNTRSLASRPSRARATPSTGSPRPRGTAGGSACRCGSRSTR